MRYPAFTFIELVLVMTIVLLLGSFSEIFSNQFIAVRNTSIATHALREALSRAETYARSGRAGSDWGVVQIDQALIIFSGDQYATRTPEHDEKIALPARITVTGLDETTFDTVDGLVGGGKVINIQGPNQMRHLSLSAEGAVQEYE
ncbi:MAG: hypothetical protein ACEQSB_04655 [Undibacterium sp.]